MTADEPEKPKSAARRRADEIARFRCRNLIAVIENPDDMRNVGTVIRNVNALGVEKAYVIDPRGALPDDWQDMRERGAPARTSVSAAKWSFVRRVDSTDACIDHLAKNRFTSFVTSPHVKGKANATLDAAGFTAHAKLAVWFGNEARGIRDAALAHAELCISIPMFVIIESRNLGTASGIVLYEATRRRRAYQQQFRKRNRRVPVAEPPATPPET